MVASDIPGNGYAEHVVVPAPGLLPEPANVSFEVAASVPVAAGTAYHALEKTHVGNGDVVLAHGAAGGVGTVLVQLARERGGPGDRHGTSGQARLPAVAGRRTRGVRRGPRR